MVTEGITPDPELTLDTPEVSLGTPSARSSGPPTKPNLSGVEYPPTECLLIVAGVDLEKELAKLRAQEADSSPSASQDDLKE